MIIGFELRVFELFWPASVLISKIPHFFVVFSAVFLLFVFLKLS